MCLPGRTQITIGLVIHNLVHEHEEVQSIPGRQAAAMLGGEVPPWM